MKKIKDGAEGLVIIAIGIFLLINTLGIKANPIHKDGWAGVLSEAKLIPVAMSVGILALGCVLFVKLISGKSSTVRLSREEWIRAGVVLFLTVIYGYAVYRVKFMIPTLIYALAIFFYLNYRHRKPLTILIFAAVAVVVGLWGMPLLINLKLPLI